MIAAVAVRDMPHAQFPSPFLLCLDIISVRLGLGVHRQMSAKAYHSLSERVTVKDEMWSLQVPILSVRFREDGHSPV
jgi:hypothetical protein